MKKLTPRTWTFILAGLALLAVILLASSLNELRPDPGNPLPLSDLSPDVYDPSLPSMWGRILLALIRVMFILAWLAVPLIIILFIVSKEWRKRILRDLMVFLPLLLFVYWLATSTHVLQSGETLNINQINLGNLTAETASTPDAMLPVYTEPPGWVTTATIIGLATGITLLFAVILFLFWQRSKQMLTVPLRLVEQELQAAIDAIEAGGDLRDVILRTYYQMIEALKQYRNIQRDRDMTPHEFETYLIRRGLPAGPVHNLTMLFEQVRYGGLAPGRQEERAAIANLSAIVAACQKTRGE